MFESAGEAFARRLRDTVAPALRGHGLRGSGQSYLIPDPSQWAQLGFQKSTSSTADEVRFTINLKVTSKEWWDEQRRDHSPLNDTTPGVDRESWDAHRLEASVYPARPSANTSGEGRTMRLGRLMPGVMRDHWWLLTAEDADAVMAEALGALVTYGLPWLRDELRRSAPYPASG